MTGHGRGCGCAMCEGQTRQQIIGKVQADVERVGWSCISVFGEAGRPGFTYTVGLTHTFEHPELIIYGIEPRLAQSFLNGCGDRIKAGEPFEAGQRRSDVIADFDVRVDAHGPSGLNIARTLYGDMRALQIVLPDHEGRLPGEPGCDPHFELFQYPQTEDGDDGAASGD